MTPALLVLAAAAPQRLLIVDETVRVPASQIRAVNLSIAARQALFECEFNVMGPGRRIKLALMTWEQAERLRRGERTNEILKTRPSSGSGSLQAFVRGGRYRLILDNRAEDRAPSDVHVKVWLTFGAPLAIELSSRKRVVIVLASLTFFFAVVWYTGRKLWIAIRARRTPWPPGPSS
jgi:hypothetical protein